MPSLWPVILLLIIRILSLFQQWIPLPLCCSSILFAVRLIIFDDTVNPILNADAKKSIYQDIVSYDNIPAVVDLYSTQIFEA